MSILEAYRENNLEQYIKDIQFQIINSREYQEFYMHYNINPQEYEPDTLILAYHQWNTKWGKCIRCNPTNCDMKERHVEIRDGIIEKVKCTKKHRRAYAQLPARMIKNIEDYEPQNNSQRIAKDRAIELMANPRSVIYWGEDKGIGKTHLASCLFMSIEKTRSYYNFVSLINIIKDRFTSNTSIDAITDTLFNVELLFLDDFGRGNYTEWIKDLVYDMIERRVNQDLLTILTCDMSVELLTTRLGRGIVSRLKEFFAIIRMNGNDYRDKLMEV